MGELDGRMKAGGARQHYMAKKETMKLPVNLFFFVHIVEARGRDGTLNRAGCKRNRRETERPKQQS